MKFYYLQAYRVDYDDDLQDCLAFRGFPVPATTEDDAYYMGQHEATIRYNDDKSVENDWVIERW